MTALNSVEIPIPSDWPAFERACIILWRLSIGDPTLHQHGRSGQKQDGIDLVGYRNGDTGKLVFIQCKRYKKKLTLEQVRKELEQAIKKEPAVKEFIIATTAPDDVNYTTWEITLNKENNSKDRKLIVKIIGWNTLSLDIQKYPEAHKQFDPSYIPHSEQIVEGIEKISKESDNHTSELAALRSDMQLLLNRSSNANFVEILIDREHSDLNVYRDLMNGGQYNTALKLLDQKEKNIPKEDTGIIISRILALKAHCYRFLGRFDEAKDLFKQSFKCAENEPRAKASQAAYLYLNDSFEECAEFCTLVLKSDETNEGVVSWLIFSASKIDDDIVIEEIVPKKLQETVIFAQAYINYLITKKNKREALEVSKAYLTLFPDNQYIKSLHALSYLNNFLSDDCFDSHAIIEEDVLSKLSDVAEIFEKDILEISNTENPSRADRADISFNLSTVYLLLGKTEQAVILASKSLEFFPDHYELILRVAQGYYNQGNIDEASKYLSQLRNYGPHLKIKIAILSSLFKWDEITNLTLDNDVAAELSIQKGTTYIISQCAEILNNNSKNAEDEILQFIDQFEGKKSDLVILVSPAAHFKFQSVIDKIYELAIEDINEHTNVTDRLNISRLARQKRDWNMIVSLLNGKIATDHHSEELILLSQAFANKFPVTQSACEFYDNLPTDILGIPEICEQAAITFNNAGDIQRAISLVEKLIEENQNCLRIILFYWGLLAIQNNELLKNVVPNFEPDLMIGEPLEFMRLAFILSDYGKEATSLRIAYDTVCMNPNNSKIAMNYFGLITLKGDKLKNILEIDCVADETVFIVKDEFSNEQTIRIDSSCKVAMQGVYDCNTITASTFLGKHVGEFGELGRDITGTKKWEIIEIKSIYVEMFQQITSSFNMRFPEVTDFQKLTVDENDISLLIEYLTNNLSSEVDFRNLYDKSLVPIEMLASLRHKNAIEAIEYLELTGGISTCAGTNEEMSVTDSTVRSYLRGTAILDLTALLTIHKIEACDIIESAFNNIFIPRSVIDNLEIYIQELKERINCNQGSLFAKDGQLHFLEFNRSDTRDRISNIELILKWAKKYQYQHAITITDEIYETSRQILNIVPNKFLLEPIFLAKKENAILVTEDQKLRTLAIETFSQSSTWLQSILRTSLKKSIASKNSYNSKDRAYPKTLSLDQIEAQNETSLRFAIASAKIARLKHSFVSLNGSDLSLLSENDQKLFESASIYIGTPDADISSHILAFAEFVNVSWNNRAPTVETEKNTSILLRNLIFKMKSDWREILKAVLSKTSKYNNFINYLERWLRGHFILDLYLAYVSAR